jgi:SAM-dependent methyltransferase
MVAGKQSGLDRKQHWEEVYGSKKAHETSWYQPVPAPSLAMIRNAANGGAPSLIDVGGGASLLVDCLLDQGFCDLAVLDISGRALGQARARLGSRATRVDWIQADVTQYEPGRTWDIWHDRAAFHFLTGSADRSRYVGVLQQAVAVGGQAIIAAFAPDGPRKCSGLEIVRYDARALGAELGPRFVLEEERYEVHLTPAGREQRFGFHRFRREA